MLKVTFENLRKWYEEILDARSRAREEEAQRKAQQAEEKAANAENEAEAEKHRTVAEVWRQVDKDFRREKELLKEQLAAVSRKASQEAKQNIQSMQIKTEKDKIQVTSGDKTIALPVPSDTLLALSTKKDM